MRRAVLLCLLVAPPALAGEPPSSDEPTAADVAASPPPGEEGGRTDEPERDSVLRDIGQGVLVPPRVAVEVTMAPVRGSVWLLDRYKLVDRWKQIFFDDSETYGLYPTAVLDSSYGFTIGARFVHRDVLGHHEHLALRASAGGEYRAQADAGVRTGTLLGEHVRLEARGEFERRPSDAFYGIGNSTDAMATYHRQELVRAATTLDLLAIDRLHLRAAGAITDLAYGRSGSGPAIDMVYDASVLTGWTGVRNVYGELEVRWDGRGRSSDYDQAHTFDSGWLLSVFTGRIHQLEGGNDYWRWGGDVQKYFRLGVGPRALSTRLYVEGVTGEISDVAFTELPQLGGKALLRGYPRDRFRDRLAAMTSVEYTWDLGRYPMASVFVDVGRVYPSVRDLHPANMRMGYGVSLQLHSDRQFLATVSIASSLDGGVFVDLAFDPVFDLEPRVEQR